MDRERQDPHGCTPYASSPLLFLPQERAFERESTARLIGDLKGRSARGARARARCSGRGRTRAAGRRTQAIYEGETRARRPETLSRGVHHSRIA